MRSEREIRKLREILWDLANKLAEEDGNSALLLDATLAAQILDWVLGESEWYFSSLLREKGGDSDE